MRLRWGQKEAGLGADKLIRVDDFFIQTGKLIITVAKIALIYLYNNKILIGRF